MDLGKTEEEADGIVRGFARWAALSLSREVVWPYWQIGDEVRQQQARHGLGVEVVGRLAADLEAAFSGVAGSPARTYPTCAFAEAFPDPIIVP